MAEQLGTLLCPLPDPHTGSICGRRSPVFKHETMRGTLVLKCGAHLRDKSRRLKSPQGLLEDDCVLLNETLWLTRLEA